MILKEFSLEETLDEQGSCSCILMNKDFQFNHQFGFKTLHFGDKFEQNYDQSFIMSHWKMQY